MTTLTPKQAVKGTILILTELLQQTSHHSASVELESALMNLIKVSNMLNGEDLYDPFLLKGERGLKIPNHLGKERGF